MNYRVGDSVIRLKNAALARKKEVTLPYSNITKGIAQVLTKEGFLDNVKEETVEGKRSLVVNLRYQNRKPVISNVNIVSKPSLRVYISLDEIQKNQGKAMTAVLSTNGGVMTGRQAQKKGIGGELLFKIW